MKKQTHLKNIVVISGLALGGLFSVVMIQPLFGSQFTIFASPVPNGGRLVTCPGAYCGYANYAVATPGWGWTPMTNTTIFTAANGGGRNDVRIEFTGLYGDSGCNLSSVTIPNPPTSPQYIFCIYFRTNPPPTTNYPIVLTGFKSN